jgi:hypothetical protein
MSIALTYGSMEFNPVVWAGTKAWWFINGKWHSINYAEVGMNAYSVPEAEFHERFGPLPALPVAAFRARARTE